MPVRVESEPTKLKPHAASDRQLPLPDGQNNEAKANQRRRRGRSCGLPLFLLGRTLKGYQPIEKDWSDCFCERTMGSKPGAATSPPSRGGGSIGAAPAMNDVDVGVDSSSSTRSSPHTNDNRSNGNGNGNDNDNDNDPLTCPLHVGDLVRVSEEYVSNATRTLCNQLVRRVGLFVDPPPYSCSPFAVVPSSVLSANPTAGDKSSPNA